MLRYAKENDSEQYIDVDQVLKQRLQWVVGMSNEIINHPVQSPNEDAQRGIQEWCVQVQDMAIYINNHFRQHLTIDLVRVD